MLTSDSTPPSEQSSAGRTILEAAGRKYPWAEVLTAAYFFDLAGELHAALEDALAALAYAEEQGFDVDEAGAAGAEAFRLEHGLVTGEELDGWLAHVGLDLESFDAHFAGRALASRFAAELEEIREHYAPDPDDVIGAMWAATLLSDSFDAFVGAFARRLAQQSASEATPEPEDAGQALDAGAARVPEALRDAERLEELGALDATYLRAERELVPPERVARELREREYQLTRIEVTEACFRTLDQAHEALQCVNADGLTLDEVAEQAGLEPCEATYFVDEAPEGAVALLSAEPGRAAEPEPTEEGFLVRVLLQRWPPEPGDPELEERVRTRLIAAHFDALVSLHVTRSFDPWTAR